MSIVALHFIAFKSISLIQIYVYNLPIKLLGNFPVLHSGYLWWSGYIIVGILFPITISYIVNKINCRAIKSVREMISR